VPDLVTRPAAVHTVSMKARLIAAGLSSAAAQPGPAAGGAADPASARVEQARSRARQRGDAQRQALRPLGLVFIAVVITASAQTHPAPGLRGTGIAVTLLLAAYAVTVLTAISVGWGRRGPAAQVVVAALIGGCAVALAVLQPHGPVEIAPSLGVWIAAVRLAPAVAAATAGAITAALALAVGLTEHPAAQSAITATLVCVLLAVIGQFLRRGRESQDRTELLMAQLQDAREAEAEAAALAERSRIAGELHDVLAHSLSALAIQLQGARKLAGREAVSAALRGTIERSAELAKAGLGDARQAVGALRGERLPTLDQLAALVEDFRRDTGSAATLRIDGTTRPLPAEASLALFRGAQEALTNITRYAPGATTAVTVSYQADRTVLTVEDHHPGGPDPAGADPAGADPAGADPAGARSGPDLLAAAGGGHGLAAMRERTQRAGGTAQAGPTADGWLVELEVPA
jgi:signal transduction histidine kinase